MRKFFVVAAILATLSIQAQSFKETFDGNSLEWTECTFKNKDNIQYVIDKGVLTIRSGEPDDNTGYNFITGELIRYYSYAESFCYAPLNVLRPFKIIMHLRYDNDDFPCGFRFNEMDNGNYYDIELREWSNKILFNRYVNNERVGGLVQGFLFPKLGRNEWYELVLTSEGNQLSLTMQGIPVFAIRYMPLEYSGFSFWTWGEQEMRVDDVEFIQL